MLFVSKIVTSMSRTCKSPFIRQNKAVRGTAYVIQQHVTSVLQSLIVCLCETGYDVVKAELVCACVCLCVCVCLFLSTYLSVDSTAVISAYDLCERGSVIGTKGTVLSASVFRRVHRIAKSDYWLLHVCLVSPSVRMEYFGSH